MACILCKASLGLVYLRKLSVSLIPAWVFLGFRIRKEIGVKHHYCRYTTSPMDPQSALRLLSMGCVRIWCSKPPQSTPFDTEKQLCSELLTFSGSAQLPYKGRPFLLLIPEIFFLNYDTYLTTAGESWNVHGTYMESKSFAFSTQLLYFFNKTDQTAADPLIWLRIHPTVDGENEDSQVFDLLHVRVPSSGLKAETHQEQLSALLSSLLFSLPSVHLIFSLTKSVIRLLAGTHGHLSLGDLFFFPCVKLRVAPCVAHIRAADWWHFYKTTAEPGSVIGIVFFLPAPQCFWSMVLLTHIVDDLRKTIFF